MENYELKKDTYTNIEIFNANMGIDNHDYSNDPNIGNFNCSFNNLTSLKYCPTKIYGNFRCHVNSLTSLEYCPIIINGDFDCSNNKLTSLKYCPTKVYNFSCFANFLNSLEYCPIEVEGNFWCSDDQLISLEFCPAEVKGNFDCSMNQIKSLKYCPNKIGGNLICYNNLLTSLAGIGIEYCFEVKGKMDLTYNKISECILGLLLIKELRYISMDNKKITAIINKHLVNKDLDKCKQELIEAGFKEFAKL